MPNPITDTGTEVLFVVVMIKKIDNDDTNLEDVTRSANKGGKIQ
jgi:hypothetical protein